MKLQLLPPDPPSVVRPEVAQAGYASPVRLWKVSTEADEEGRQIKNLGSFYGHVVEIAFQLANQAFYKLTFTPDLRGQGGPVYRPVYKATRKNVWVCLDVDSKTWDMEPIPRAVWFEKWFDLEDTRITVLPRSKAAIYYASVYLTMA